MMLVGQAVTGVGSVSLSIVGLSILSSEYPDVKHRARAFGVFAIVAPVVAIVMPFVSSVIIDASGWRWVTLVWIVLAIVTVRLGDRCLPDVHDVARRAELTTPTLAGITLAGIALAFSFLRVHVKSGEHHYAAFVSASIGLIALIALVLMFRRLVAPSLDLRVFRRPGATPIMAALFVVNGVNLFFFTYLMLQYRYHQSLLESAAFLLVPQVTAALGAWVGSRCSARWGGARVAMFAFGMAALASSGSLFVRAESSPSLPVLILAVAAIPIAGAVGPLTHALMDLAPDDGNAGASSVRNAFVNLGIAVGGLLVGAVVFDELDADTERTLEAYRLQADAFRLAGILCCCAYVAATVLVLIHRRRVVGIRR
jgi:MFS family permease